MKTEDEVQIRRLRKKLRQIENLERLDRPLSVEEQLKQASIERRLAPYKVMDDFKLATPLDPRFKLDFCQNDESRDVLDLLTYQVISRKVSLRSQLLEVLSSLSEDGSTYMIKSPTTGGAGDTDMSADTSHDDNSWCEDRDEVSEVPKQDVINCPQSVTDEEKMKRLADSGQSIPDPEPDQLQKETAVSSAKKHKAESTAVPEQVDHHQKKESKPPNPFRESQKRWLASEWHVSFLEGHNDLVCSVYMLGQWLLTGSRDTTVKLWDILNGKEVRNMGGHTGSVTAVIILTTEQADLIMSQLPTEADVTKTLIGLSASQDCYIKIWNLSTGKQLKSIYTFSPLTKIVFDVIDQKPCLLSGSAGGKVELWDIESGATSSSVRAHDDGVTGLQLSDGHVYSSSADGVITVFQIRDGELRVIFVSENVKLTSGGPVTWRHIRSLVVANQRAYIGDDAMNIKVLDWRNGLVHKLSNHTTEFGATDALCAPTGLDLLLASGYDLDNGLGFINDEKYLCSLCDESSSRIVSLHCVPNDPDDPDHKCLTIVTAGMELCVWRQIMNVIGSSVVLVLSYLWDVNMCFVWLSNAVSVSPHRHTYHLSG
ncbi:hypothetical protein LSH36_744g01047 [Paralvinella palmiformis]|uniref:Uncharacterized protein n=1 Tax=Paralvinella palmiformis TaxID=53620 RepID=A0AAD9J114_9ANNE|nr:hypothetical protein LSH36_744g01047 [Paralvinella palmiformis]